MVWAFACDDGPKPPVACASIPLQTTYVGLKTLVYPCFEDPEMGELTLAAMSSNPGVATSEVLGDKVQIVGVTPGTAAITVTATDPDGLTGELNFEALVPNRPPRLREDDHGIEVEIPAFRLEVGGPAVELVLSEYFVDPDGQQLTYAATSSNTRIASVALSADTLAVTGLSVGTATVSLTATDPGGLNASAHVEALALKRPGAPTSLAATLSTDERGSADSVILTWTPPADTAGSAMTGYGVEWRHESFDPGSWRRVRITDPKVTATAFSIGFDVAGYNYFRVRAINAVGDGDPSNVDSIFVVFHGLPDPPRFTARKTANGYRTYLQWEPSPSDTATIERWAIDRSKDGGAWDFYLTPRASERALELGFPYVDSMRFRIAARYEDRGQGEWSNVVRFTWEGPDQPTNLAAAADGDSVVVLTWTAPADTGNSAIMGYMIETSSEGGRNWHYLVPNTRSTETTYRHGNLAGGIHLYAVSAITWTGVGPPSNVIEMELEDVSSMRQWPGSILSLRR